MSLPLRPQLPPHTTAPGRGLGGGGDPELHGELLALGQLEGLQREDAVLVGQLLRALRLMEQAVADGTASPRDLAFRRDRTLVNEGREQIYGTQIGLSCLMCGSGC
ncbi:hypothetical protein ACIGW6_37805 [Kitasatospora aureofaciens]|uniref:hypothetical protein n=1 Tax=Kitasatospora aureofaciens TaxID=1894 RepID=UPI0037CC3FFE